MTYLLKCKLTLGMKLKVRNTIVSRNTNTVSTTGNTLIYTVSTLTVINISIMRTVDIYTIILVYL